MPHCLGDSIQQMTFLRCQDRTSDVNSSYSITARASFRGVFVMRQKMKFREHLGRHLRHDSSGEIATDLGEGVDVAHRMNLVGVSIPTRRRARVGYYHKRSATLDGVEWECYVHGIM